MKRLSTLSFLILLLLEEATASNVERTVLELKEKHREKLPSSLAGSAFAAHHNSDRRKDGRVFYPIRYGADPTGAHDSSDAILNVLKDAFKLRTGLQLVPGINDFGGVVIDLQGGNFKISKPIRFPSPGGGNIVVRGGTLRASNHFPGDRHLVELWSEISPPIHKNVHNIFHYEDITFRDILFDSSYRGGGIFVIDSARIRINNCFFLHFTTQGIQVYRSHETFISGCFLGQHSTVGGSKDEKHFSGTAIELAGNDNAVTDVAIFSAAVGILLRGQANILTGVHCYNKATYFGGIGILKLAGSSQTRIDNCYLDYNAIVMEDPVQVHVTNGFFLGGANVVLKSIKGRISGLNIVNNMFSGHAKKKVPIIALQGKFTKVDQVVIDRNNVKGMRSRSTVGKLKVAGKGTRWVADFRSTLLFPNRINYLQYSIYTKGKTKFTAHAVTNVSNNVVVVESQTALDGVVSVIVEQ